MLKILIVEDEDIIRKGLVFTIDWLSMDCVVCAEAANGEEGLRKIIENKPDVVITDIKMPKMNGIEMIRQGLEHVKFESVFLTSYAEFEYARKAIELKAHDYLVKPIDEDKIIEVIQTLHDKLDVNKKVEIALKYNPSSRLDLNHYMELDHSENGYVAKSIEIMKQRYIEKVGIETISEELGVSARYLSRKFKEVTNHSFLDLLNAYRVQQSIKLLNTGKYRVYEISDMTGFTDYKHFCTVFKRYTSMSPTRFIKNKTNENNYDLVKG